METKLGYFSIIFASFSSKQKSNKLFEEFDYDLVIFISIFS